MSPEPEKAVSRFINRCPWRERALHNPGKPEILKAKVVKQIEQQIVASGNRPLPYLGIAKQFFRCKDCYAVWVAGSVLDRPTQESICGIFDDTDVWKPYPPMK
jgi:hypothetical protein